MWERHLIQNIYNKQFVSLAKRVILNLFHLFTAETIAYKLTHKDERLSYV